MTTYFVSDIHLDPQRAHTYQRFVNFIQMVGKEANAIYILGDLFEYWIGDDAVDYLGHRSILETLKSLSNEVKIYIMRGNRDLLIGEEFAREIDGELLADPTVIDIYGKRILLTHGDMLCTDDVEHQKFREIVLTKQWQEPFLSLPIEERNQRALEMRKQSTMGKQAKSAEMMDVNRDAVIDILTQYNCRYMIHGHVHKPDVYRFHLNGEPAFRYVMGDWDSDNDGVISLDPSGNFNLFAPSRNSVISSSSLKNQATK